MTAFDACSARLSPRPSAAGARTGLPPHPCPHQRQSVTVHQFDKCFTPVADSTPKLISTLQKEYLAKIGSSQEVMSATRDSCAWPTSISMHYTCRSQEACRWNVPQHFARIPRHVSQWPHPPPSHPRCGGVSKISPSSPLHNFCIALVLYLSTRGMSISQIYVPNLVLHPAYVLPFRALLPLFDISCYTLT